MQPYMEIAPSGGSLTTTTSYVLVPNLTLAVDAGAMYRFEAYVTYQGSTTSAQFRPAMGGSCTATFTSYGCRIEQNATGGSSSFVHAALAPSGAGGATAVSAATTTYACVINGLIVVNAAGTLQVQASHVAAACTVQSGGRFILEQLA
jgi:hypothetical protein